MWALVQADATEHLAMEHCRSCLKKLRFTKGDALYSYRHRKILEIVEDTSPGIHDGLLSACDDERYRLLGVKGNQASCAGNLRQALEEKGSSERRCPPRGTFSRWTSYPPTGPTARRKTSSTGLPE